MPLLPYSLQYEVLKILSKLIPGRRCNNEQARKPSYDTVPKFAGLIIHVIRKFFSAGGVWLKTKQLCDPVNISRGLISSLNFCHFMVPMVV